MADDHYEQLDAAERWFLDGLRIMEAPGFFMMEQVDMQPTQEVIASLRQQDIKSTYTHVIIRAIALVFNRHPELNRIMVRDQRVTLGSVDIGLSISSDTSVAVAPTLVLKDVEAKSLPQLTQEIITRASQVRSDEAARLAKMRKAARLFPFSWMRRKVLRLATSRLSMLREKTGTFHVTTTPHVYQGIPLKFATPAVLSIARVEERAVVVAGEIVVRPMVMLGFTADHRLWQGNSASLFLSEVKRLLESRELLAEIISSTTVAVA